MRIGELKVSLDPGRLVNFSDKVRMERQQEHRVALKSSKTVNKPDTVNKPFRAKVM